MKKDKLLRFSSSYTNYNSKKIQMLLNINNNPKIIKKIILYLQDINLFLYCLLVLSLIKKGHIAIKCFTEC
jgi:hypothetical protein